ncbi:MAG: MoxR family ATPase [Ilumatobacteraceae bacterium]
MSRALQENVAQVLKGKPETVRLAVACFLAEGHLLIEDLPGTGKTSLARAMAQSVGGSVKRVQFTPDLLPSDITGTSIYRPNEGEFVFREGPAFANVLVADEVNRASPKTQAALLEVMEERQVTVDGVSRLVPRPFMVVATQNPMDFHGTYPLPEVQLDRFAMRISIGYADRATEMEVMASPMAQQRVELTPVLRDDQVVRLLERIKAVTVSEPLRSYVADIVMKSRTHPDLRLGISTRGTITLLAVARALAIGEGRAFVTPDDIKDLLTPVLAHRIAVTPAAELDGILPEHVLDTIVDGIDVPRLRLDE